MADALTLEERVNPRLKPERLAWIVLLVAFVCFVVICAGSTYTLQYILFQSSIPMQTILQAGRGTLSVREKNEAEQAEIGQREVINDTTIRTDRTDASSQATITLNDHSNAPNIIAVLTLKGATQSRFLNASMPRFNWSTPVYEAELDSFSGEIDVWINEDLSKPIEIRIRSMNGFEFRLRDSGHYTLSAADTQVRLANYEGEAILIASDRLTAHSVPVGQQITLRQDDSTVIREPTLTNLLNNSDLVVLSREQGGSQLAGRLTDWTCHSGPQENLPVGSAGAGKTPDGRTALRLVRLDGANTNGETRCSQQFPELLGRDVSQYDYIGVRVTLYISYQSLNRCGVLASECPLMLQVNYTNDNGKVVPWNHGIYGRDDINTNYPLKCDTCWDEHVQVYEGGWYTYDSGNILETIPFERFTRDAVAEFTINNITEVIFYASGHEYDVYVDRIELLVGNTTPLDDAN